LSNALQAFTYGQSITSENIANVDTPGYTAQVLNLESLSDFGGVAVAGVGSTRNTFLYNQIYSQVALQGYTTAQLSALNQVAAILPEVDNPAASGGLNAAINNLASAWTTLSGAPASTADQTAVLNAMQTLAGLFETDSNQLYALQQNLNNQVIQTVTQVNSLEDQILSLNKQIVDLGGQQSAQTSTLIDQRQVDAQALVGLTGAAVNYNTDGAMIITFNGGTLVDGVQSYHLGTMPSLTTPGVTDIGYVSVPGYSEMTDVTADFTSGTLGGLYAGQANVKQAVLTLNKMASGIIQYSNEVNESANAPGTTINNPLFFGTEASDISVNTELPTNLDYILAGNDPANPGNLAAAQAAMTTLNMYSEVETINPTPGQGGFDLNAGAPLDPTQPLAGQIGLLATEPDAPSGTLVINAGNNAVNVNWNTGDSLNQIVAMINAQGGGAIYATLQTVSGTTNATALPQPPATTGQYIHIYSDAPLSIYDASGNLGQVLSLNSVLYSSGPINNVPTTGVNQVEEYGPAPTFTPQPLDSTANELALFTQPVVPAGGGTVEVDGNPGQIVTWTPNQDLATIMAAIQNSAPPGTLIASFNESTQQAELINAGPPQNPGILTPGNPLQSVSINDLTGNLTQVLNLDTNTNATQLFTQFTTTMKNTTTAVQSEQTQATNLVNATQALQTQQSGVNTDAQLAQAMIYENAYDAAVRMQYVLENMLNFLITQTGTPNYAGAPTGS
jgi:flagellar hook-associated protein 1 FlgK